MKRFDATIAPVRACAGYGLIVLGAVALFGAAYGLSLGKGRVGRALVYLGRVSYGLYVFHILMINASGRLLKAVGVPAVQGSVSQAGLALGLTAAAAAISYEVYERPFLRLKQRWTFVRSRAEGALLGRGAAGLAVGRG